jgi:hypothetical protein
MAAMKKLKLEDLEVATFTTVGASDDRTGTVHGHSETIDFDCSGGPSAGGYCQSFIHNPCSGWTDTVNEMHCMH